MLFGGATLACLVKVSFPYDWSWVECLLFGIIFAATDPVAVIAVLKEVRLLHVLRAWRDWKGHTVRAIVKR